MLGHEFALDGELVRREAHGLLGDGLLNTADLEHHAAGLDDGDPVLGRAFTGTHAGLGRLLGDGLVGEDLDPDLTAALDVTRHGDTSRLDLVGGDPRGFQRDETVGTVGHGVSAIRLTGQSSAVDAAIFDSLRH